MKATAQEVSIMARYHINRDGEAGRCTASPGNCPFAGEDQHYSSLEDARAAYEQAQQSVPTAARKAPAEPVYETVVPDPVNERVVKMVAPHRLSYDDLITVNGNTHYVRQVKVGYKNAQVTVTDLKKGERVMSFPLDQELEAEVTVETKESVQMRERARKELFLERGIKNYTPQRDKVVAQISEKVAQGYALDGHNIDELVKAEANDHVVGKYQRVLEQVRTHTEDAFPYTRAYEEYRKELQEEVNMAARYGNSVSTNESYNLIQREEMAAKARFLADGYRMMF